LGAEGDVNANPSFANTYSVHFAEAVWPEAAMDDSNIKNPANSCETRIRFSPSHRLPDPCPQKHDPGKNDAIHAQGE
jgi:hypothetical protein